jgi:hypothetical protein
MKEVNDGGFESKEKISVVQIVSAGESGISGEKVNQMGQKNVNSTRELSALVKRLKLKLEKDFGG